MSDPKLSGPNPFQFRQDQTFRRIRVVDKPTAAEGELSRDVVKAAAAAVSGPTVSEKAITKADYDAILTAMKKDGQITRTERGFLSHLLKYGQQFNRGALEEFGREMANARRVNPDTSVDDADPATEPGQRTPALRGAQTPSNDPVTPGFVKKLRDAADQDSLSFDRRDFDTNRDQRVDQHDTDYADAAYADEDHDGFHLLDDELSAEEFACDTAVSEPGQAEARCEGGETGQDSGGAETPERIVEELRPETEARHLDDQTMRKLIDGFARAGFSDDQTVGLIKGLFKQGSEPELKGRLSLLLNDGHFADTFFKLGQAALRAADKLKCSGGPAIGPTELGEVMMAGWQQIGGFEDLAPGLSQPQHFDSLAGDRLGSQALMGIKATVTSYLVLKEYDQALGTEPAPLPPKGAGAFGKMAEEIRSGQLRVVSSLSAEMDDSKAVAEFQPAQDEQPSRLVMGFSPLQDLDLATLFSRANLPQRAELVAGFTSMRDDMFQIQGQDLAIRYQDRKFAQSDANASARMNPALNQMAYIVYSLGKSGNYSTQAAVEAFCAKAESPARRELATKLANFVEDQVGLGLKLLDLP